MKFTLLINVNNNCWHFNSAYLVFLNAFLLSADFFLQKIPFGILSVSNSLDPHQARGFVGPDLGPNCLERLSADNTCRKIVNITVNVLKFRTL